MATNVTDILDRKAGEAPRPGMVPGSFRLVVKDVEAVESSQKKTPGVRFKCGVRAALEDVKPEDLAQMGDLSLKGDDIDFWLTEGSLYRLDEFLEDALKMKINGRTYRQVIPECIGKEFVALYKSEEIVRDGKPAGEYRARADSFAPVK